ncbi:uncharacterized protein LOC110624504 isoform X2 [Manihot esculenta]|uniref:uncharacterized protein LOC110624504 isoform X2 n=1 Tax=Manihot esculenta TaxID=3983 RepID=UPI000B5D4159|nr:uncharacterized protein LOC110624504 isoform X2 [Manihot esculenta]
MSKVTETSNISAVPLTNNNSVSMGELQNIQAAYRLDGKNYQMWSRLVLTFLKERGKLSHLLGTGLDPKYPKFGPWAAQDSIVMSWLWNSMLPEISDAYMFLSTAKEIWEAIKQTYSKVHTAAQIYEIKTKISATKQGSQSVTEYSNYLKSLWQEMDYYEWIQTKCSEDAAILERYIEKDRIYDFLARLNIKFDAIRVEVLGKEELPSLNEVIAIVLAEEVRREVNAAMKNYSFEQRVSKSSGQTDLSKPFNKDSLWCTWCKKPRHTKEKCWKLHGKPQSMTKTCSKQGGRSKGQRQVHVGNTHSRNEDPPHVDLNNVETKKLKGRPVPQAAARSAPACSPTPQPDTIPFKHLAVNQAAPRAPVQSGGGGGSVPGTIRQGVGSASAYTIPDAVLGPERLARQAAARHTPCRSPAPQPDTVFSNHLSVNQAAPPAPVQSAGGESLLGTIGMGSASARRTPDAVLGLGRPFPLAAARHLPACSPPSRPDTFSLNHPSVNQAVPPDPVQSSSGGGSLLGTIGKERPAPQAAAACRSPPLQPDTISISHLSVNQAAPPAPVQSGGGGSLLGTIGQCMGSASAQTTPDVVLGPGRPTSQAAACHAPCHSPPSQPVNQDAPPTPVQSGGSGSLLETIGQGRPAQAAACHAPCHSPPPQPDIVSSNHLSVNQAVPPAPVQSGGGGSLLETIGQGRPAPQAAACSAPACDPPPLPDDVSLNHFAVNEDPPPDPVQSGGGGGRSFLRAIGQGVVTVLGHTAIGAVLGPGVASFVVRTAFDAVVANVNIQQEVEGEAPEPANGKQHSAAAPTSTQAKDKQH